MMGIALQRLRPKGTGQSEDAVAVTYAAATLFGRCVTLVGKQVTR